MMKKEVCRYWVRNNCTKGSNCNFLHEFQQDKMPLCTNPNCNNNMCFFKHELKKTLCSNYENGFCSFGNTCPHLHVTKEGPPPLIAPLFTFQEPSLAYQKEMSIKSTYQKKPCAYWARNGWCPYFEMCNFTH